MHHQSVHGPRSQRAGPPQVLLLLGSSCFPSPSPEVRVTRSGLHAAAASITLTSSS